ncbi:FG-GAP-like repeat-containing protein [Sorangium cellulosum]|uniref:FG-GAP-like repeat-containing protein n=1 Tax=Sorangium cellulosum TaxID=56 RepID=UPI0013318A47|nr:FG-GAP-like repeat-containing protein [Sorangium cellulosum]
MSWFNVGRVRCDFNADGYDDVAVSAVSVTSSRDDVVYFYYGQAGAEFEAMVNGEISSSDDATRGFGSSLSCAGDVDGDGLADILVGAPSSDAHNGEARLYFSDGGEDFSGRFVDRLSGMREDGQFGGSVAAVGDVNGDGFDDVAVGEWAAPYAYLYMGDASGRLSRSVELSLGVSAQDLSAMASSAGDVNGDGFSDVMVSFVSSSSARHQTVRLYSGGPGATLDAEPEMELMPPTEDSSFASAAASAGDMNGDGFGDVIVGSPGIDRAYIYLGSPEGLNPVPDLTLDGQGSTSFGLVVASAGDMNGDGFGDVAVGTADYVGSPGAVYVYAGGAGAALDNRPDVAFHAPALGDGFGSVLGSSGDLNGDGYSDLVVAAPSGDAVYIFLGQSDLRTPDVEGGSVSQPLSDLTFGAAVSRR